MDMCERREIVALPDHSQYDCGRAGPAGKTA